MISALQRWVTAHPDAPFIRTPYRTITVEDFYYSVVNRAQSLASTGFAPGSRLAVYSPNPLDTAELFFACQSAGLAVVPLPYGVPTPELEKLLEIVIPDGIFCQFQDRALFEKTNVQILSLEEQSPGPASCQTQDFQYASSPKDTCVILLTSGSSGKPKAVELSIDNFIASFDGWNSLLRFTKSDHYLCCLPLNHVGGLSIVTRAVLGGFPITLMAKFQKDQVSDFLTSGESSGDITLVSLVPAMLHILIDGRDKNPFHPNLRAIVMGGSAMPSGLEDQCLKLKLPIVKSYGMTETCSGVMGFYLNDSPDKRRSSGKPFAGVNIIVDNDQIIIQGKQVMKGYLNQTEAIGQFKTQDRGHLDEDGYLFIKGRSDDVIISGGENIRLSEIEAVVNQHPWISESVALGMPDDRWGEKLVVVITMNESITHPENIQEDELSEKLSRHCRKYLPGYKIPKQFIRIKSIPKTELGKVERKRLKGICFDEDNLLI